MADDPLAQLGLTLDLPEGDLVSDALLIMKVHKAGGGVSVTTRLTDGTDWVTARGLIDIAMDVESSFVDLTTSDDDPDT